MKLIKVLVEATGVETVVSEAYYKKYAKEGLTNLGEHQEEKKVPKTTKVTKATKVTEEA